MVRRRGPAARPRRRRAGRLLVQPDPLTAPIRACRGARSSRGESHHGATGRPETWDQWLPAARIGVPILKGADTVGPRPRCCRTSHREPASEDGRPRLVRRQRHEVRWQAVEPPFPRLGWPRIGPQARIPVGGHALHRPREAGPGCEQHPRRRLGSREGHAASRAPRQHPQPPGPPRPLVRTADHGGGPRRENDLPHDGAATGPGGPRRLHLARAGRGGPPHGPGHGRCRHGRHGLLAGPGGPAHRARPPRRQPRLPDRDRHAVRGRRHRAGAAAARGGPGHRPGRVLPGRAHGARADVPADRRRGHGGRDAARASRPWSPSPPARTRSTAASTARVPRATP